METLPQTIVGNICISGGVWYLLTRVLFHTLSLHEPLMNLTSWLSRAYYIIDRCMEKRSMARSHKGILNSIWMKVNGASMHARRSENSV